MNPMKKIGFLLIMVAFFVSTGCNPPREKSLAKIRSLETRLFSPDAMSFDKVKADSLMILYADFIEDHPSDSLAPGYLFKAANLSMNSGDSKKAIELFDRYLKEYPDGINAGLSMFFKAFIYENMIRNLEKAKETYLLFIERYPENDFVKDAEMALQNLGKTPDQIIREFEAKRQADSVQMAETQAKGKKSPSRGK